MELAAAADGEAEAAQAALQLHGVVLVVQLQQVQLVVILEHAQGLSKNITLAIIIHLLN